LSEDDGKRSPKAELMLRAKRFSQKILAAKPHRLGKALRTMRSTFIRRNTG
jgi:hypothetical protein